MKNALDCKQVRQILASDYLDNELDPLIREDVDRHLADCPDCRTIHARLASVAQPLRQARRFDAPAHLWPRIQSELQRQHPSHVHPAGNRGLKIVFRWPVLAVAAAAAILLVITSSVILLPTDKPAEVTAVPSLRALTGDIEIRELHEGFGSYIEQLLL